MKIDPWRLTPIGRNIVLSRGFPGKVDFIVYKKIKEIDRVTSLIQVVDGRVLTVGRCVTKRFKYKNRPTSLAIEADGFIVAVATCWFNHKEDISTITICFSDYPILSCS